ncbi:Clp protease [Fictibacillus macauensis ZFHKF-1]|uniref:ATP-dependent Clp protease proteolytic subunit n=1 Tax=Fictibacillus macauensis ZFHKF-1 TaxID=1196324 RepID=I8UG88_9BACL|nr:head maturation protease, ClpP-related [Fictibacillus macauensis]EIT85915.1 Clp protease [Fictibacillus macauensis ZFHKF-1]
MKKFWTVKAAADQVGEISIYGDIVSYKWDDSDTTAQSFSDDLKSLGDIKTLNIYLNSPGGSVFQGNAIYSILKRHQAKVNIHVDGLAASIASVIAMAGDTIFMPENAMMMIHNPWTIAYGNSSDFRKVADDLDKMRESLIAAYQAKTGDKMDRDTLINLLDAETWLTAQECYDYGLCDVVEGAVDVAASVNKEFFAQYKNTPESLISKPEPVAVDDSELRKQILEETKADLQLTNLILGGLTK